MKNIKEVAISSEKRTVQVPIDPDTLEDLKHRFIKQTVSYKNLSDEKKAYVTSFKERMAPLEKELRELIRSIRDEYIETNTLVYLLDDQENNIMNYYLEDGTHVFSRPLRPDEKQLNILSIKQQGGI